MMSSVIFLCTLYLQQVLEVGPAASGLIFGVIGVFAALGGVIAPRIVGRFGSGRALVLGLGAQAIFTALLLMIGPNDGVMLVLIAGSVACLSHLVAIVSYGITATSGLDNDTQGVATGLITTAQQVGLTIGIPVISAIAAGHTTALTAAGADAVSAALRGIHLGLGVDAAVVAVAAVLIGVFLLGGRRGR